MAQVMTVLGFIVTVLPPLLQAANTLTLPPLAQKILAIAGIIVFLAGVLKNSIIQWQQNQQAHEVAMVRIKESYKP